MKNLPSGGMRAVKHSAVLLTAAALVIGLSALGFSTSASPEPASESRPNILVIMTDDQGHETLTSQFMPFTKSMIADQGITFTRGYISTAICCPSRASFLTGKYARHHGVHNNPDELKDPTFAEALKQSGYFTGMIGKYLNSWPGDARPEYDFWSCWLHGYNNPTMNVFGTEQSVPGYLTYVMRDYAVDFLDRVPEDKPFFLLYAPHAPHRPATPAPGDEKLYSGLAPARPPNFNPAAMPGEPAWLQAVPRMTQSDVDGIDEFRLKQLRSLKSVDESVRDILNKLREQGKLDNTFIVFYSDNGYFWGEHRLTGKDHVYEEASRVPFALRYPPLVSSARIEVALVGVIDLAPTICELAGVSTPDGADGRSLVSLLRGTQDWRDAMLLEGWPGNDDEDRATAYAPDGVPGPHYQALRTTRYLYVESDRDKSELYDMDADPYQLNNLVDDPAKKKLLRKLRKRLKTGDY